jgi:uncharacterized lipoprotein YddW (UPF0748 family)
VRRSRSFVIVVLATALVLAAGCGPGGGPAPEGSAASSPDPSVRARPPEPVAEPTEEAPAPPAPQDALARAAWVHLFDDSLKTRAGIRRVVADLVAAGATAVIAEVVRRQDAYYDSDVLPRTTDPALEPGLDVLEALIEEAHAAGLEVHAWIPFAPTWHELYADLPAPDGWVSTVHGPTAAEADRWVTRTIDGTWDTYLDPALPEVREHLAAIVGEIAARYPVDGIHLDYVRYPSNRHGYHPRALARYQAETGATGIPDPEDPAWSDWRREQVNELIRAAREAVEASGSSPVLSVAVISWGEGPGGPGTASFADTRAFGDVLQDWEEWAESGLVDALVPMDYFREAEPDQAAWLRTWLTYQAALADRTGVRVVPGIAGYLNSPPDALLQVGLATQLCGAAAMFSYQQSTADVGRPLWGDLAATGWGASAGG